MSIISSNNADLRSVKIKLKNLTDYGWKLHDKPRYQLAVPGVHSEIYAFHDEYKILLRVNYDEVKQEIEYAYIKESGIVPFLQSDPSHNKLYNMYDLNRLTQYMKFLKENSYLFP